MNNANKNHAEMNEKRVGNTATTTAGQMDAHRLNELRRRDGVF